MKITVIGAGNMGRGIGTRASAGGHEVGILDRDPAEARALAVTDGGLRPIDVGPLGRAQQPEQLGFLHISIKKPLGLGFASTIKVDP